MNVFPSAVFGFFLVSAWVATAAPLLPQPHGFGPPLRQFVPDTALALSGAANFHLGDADGDGDLDLFSMNRNAAGAFTPGMFSVRLNDGTGQFGAPEYSGAPATGEPVTLTGDVNGDGKTDVLLFYRSTAGLDGDLYVYVRGASAFLPATKWHEFFCIGTEVPVVGDFNGDGRDDVATCTRGAAADVYVALSNGTDAFIGTGVKWQDFLIPGVALPLAADVNGDGRDELIEVDRDEPGYQGNVWVAFSSGSAFSSVAQWHSNFCTGIQAPRAADINGDGNDDMLCFTPGGLLYCAVSDGVSAFTGTDDLWHSEINGTGGILAGRVNGDRNADVLTVTSTGASSVVTVCLSGGHAVPEAADLEHTFGMGTLGVPYAMKPVDARPAIEARQTVVALVTYSGAPALATEAGAFSDFPPAYWEQLVFGPAHPCVSAFLDEMSGGSFSLRSAGVFPVTVPWASGPAGVKQALANAGFSFSVRDTDGDGVTEDCELLILAITNRSAGAAVTTWYNNAGASSWPGSVQTVPLLFGSVNVACGVAACDYKYAESQAYGPAKEIVRLLGCHDMTYPWAESPHGSLLSTPGLVHMDAWHKMLLGWSRPDVYDLRRRYPGSDTIDLPHLAAGRAHPPLLFYDSARGPLEKTIVEFRSHTWFNGIPMLSLPSPHAGAFNKAGYDSWVPDRGMMFWNAPCFPDHSLEFVSAIRAGSNGFLDSAASVAGDDIITTRHYRVLGGVNRGLNTVPVGDDLPEVFTSMTTQLKPSNWEARGDLRMVKAADGAVQPEWYDSTSAGLEFRVDEGWHGTDRGTLQWSRNSAGPRGKFAPFIARISGRTSSTVYAPGAEITLTGSLGVQRPGGPQVVLRYDAAPGSPVMPALTSFSQESATFTLPDNAPEGRALVYFNGGAGGEVISNVWAISVVDCYRRWAAGFFSPAQMANPLISGPDADPDMDSLPNAMEYTLGVPPSIFTSTDHVFYRTFTRNTAGQIIRAELHWDERPDLECGVYMEAETSTDLATWTRQPAVISASPFPGFVGRTATIEGPFPRFFGRLVSFYDPNGRTPFALADPTITVRGEIWPDYDPETLTRRWVTGWIANYSNAGLSAATGVQVSTDAGGMQTRLADHSIPLRPVSRPSNALTQWTAGSLDPGAAGLIITRYSLPWNVAPGTVAPLTATITSTGPDRDATNNEITASVSVPILPPQLLFPLAGTTCRTSLALSGLSQPGVLVDVYVDSVLRGTATADAAGEWSLPVVLAAGSRDIYSRCRFAGLTSDVSPTLTLIVDPAVTADITGFRMVEQDTGREIVPSGRLDPNGWSIFMRGGRPYTFRVPVCCPDANPLVTLAFGPYNLTLTDPDGDRIFTATIMLPGASRVSGPMQICVTCGGILRCYTGSYTCD